MFAVLHAFDQKLFLMVYVARHPFLDWLMPVLSEPSYFILPIALAILYLLSRSSHAERRVVPWSVLLVVATDATTTLLKGVFQRPRPLSDPTLIIDRAASYSFPSQHAINVFALAAFLAARYPKLTAPLLLFACSVGYSRIYLGNHYPLDVFAGAALGGAWGIAAAALYRRLEGTTEPPATDATDTPGAAVSGR